MLGLGGFGAVTRVWADAMAAKRNVEVRWNRIWGKIAAGDSGRKMRRGAMAFYRITCLMPARA